MTLFFNSQRSPSSPPPDTVRYLASRGSQSTSDVVSQVASDAIIKILSTHSKSFLFIILLILIIPQTVYSFDENLPNNKFGIHLAVPDREDLIRAAELVNSSGGKWGYVPLVIQENDRDKKKWQEVFDQMRKLKLIPIIRLATQPQGGNWEAPSVDDIGGWIDFLQSLNWVVKDEEINRTPIQP